MKTNYMDTINARRRAGTRIQAKDKEKKGTFHPRALYRGLTVPYSTAPGRKRIHPKPARKQPGLQS